MVLTLSFSITPEEPTHLNYSCYIAIDSPNMPSLTRCPEFTLWRVLKPARNSHEHHAVVCRLKTQLLVFVQLTVAGHESAGKFLRENDHMSFHRGCDFFTLKGELGDSTTCNRCFQVPSRPSKYRVVIHFSRFPQHMLVS